MNIPFPEVIDSSMMASWRSCRHKFFREYLQHWKPIAQSVHLVAGAAYAKGLEEARRCYFEWGMALSDSEALGISACMEAYGDFQCPADSAKSLERTMGALEFYFERYPLADEKAVPLTLPSGKKAIEFSFAEPLDISHPVTGNPLIYCGRFDAMVDFAGGQYGLDDKTTSQLGASWPKQWDLRAQFTGYCWGAGRSQIPLHGFLVRGVSILKTKCDTLEALTYRPQWMIDEWYEGLMLDVKEMQQEWIVLAENGTAPFRKNLDHACTEYGGCAFRQICLSLDPEPWLQGNFQRRRWDPLTREEVVL